MFTTCNTVLDTVIHRHINIQKYRNMHYGMTNSTFWLKIFGK